VERWRVLVWLLLLVPPLGLLLVLLLESVHVAAQP
jgi:hypothetical protein